MSHGGEDPIRRRRPDRSKQGRAGSRFRSRRGRDREPEWRPRAREIDPVARPSDPAASRQLIRRRFNRTPAERWPYRASSMGRQGRVLALGALSLGIVAAAVFLIALFQPFYGAPGEPVRVSIPEQGGVSEIAMILDRQKVVPSALLFELRAAMSGKRSSLKPGRYTLHEGMTYGAVLDALAVGPPSHVINIAIPEGLSRREIAPIVRKAGLSGSYTDASRRSEILLPTTYGAPRAATLEGFLFPATYEVDKGTEAKVLVTKQLEAFKASLKKVNLSYSRSKNLTPYDVLTIASMVDREASVAKDRPLVAAVIYNRLKRGMPLGIDATVRYAVNNWSSPLTQSELATSSPYNTRVRRGIPPGPIGNPGLASIQAAANPARVGYLYFVVRPGGCGEHAFSATEEQFERDVQKYNQARELSGRSPAKC